jgi:hypothetical protein
MHRRLNAAVHAAVIRMNPLSIDHLKFLEFKMCAAAKCKWSINTTCSWLCSAAAAVVIKRRHRHGCTISSSLQQKKK